MSRKLALFIALTLGATGSLAQTVISNYKPGVTSEGAVYYLPKTAIRITLQIEKRYTPQESSVNIQRNIYELRMWLLLHLPNIV